MVKDKLYVCNGEPDVNVVLGIFSLSILIIMGILFVIIFNVASVFTGLILILTGLYGLSRGIKKVIFFDNIRVIYFFGNEKIIEYHECKKMYKSNDGLLIAPINVIKYVKKKRLKKMTFVCDDETLKLICDNYFNGFIPIDHSKV